MNAADPHRGQPVLVGGESLETARAAMVLVHGRGATAESILTLANEFRVPRVAYRVPQAAGNTWYPHPFLAPIERNEPWLSSALTALERIVSYVEQAGVPLERTVLLGFSQGACLALEYAARHAWHYGGVIGLSGGLIGPDGTPRDYSGSLSGTPVFLGCGDPDPHIPTGRVRESADVLRQLGGEVTMRLYPGLGHTVNQDEIDFVRNLLAGLTASGDT